MPTATRFPAAINAPASPARAPHGGASCGAVEHLEALFPNDYPHTLRAIAAVLFDALIEGLAAGHERSGHLARVALRQTDRLACELGGESIYLSGRAAARRCARDHAMRAAYDGTNRAALALAHGISEERVRQILAARQGNAPRRPKPAVHSTPAKESTS